jgi:hypothetical protein
LPNALIDLSHLKTFVRAERDAAAAMNADVRIAGNSKKDGINRTGFSAGPAANAE